MRLSAWHTKLEVANNFYMIAGRSGKASAFESVLQRVEKARAWVKAHDVIIATEVVDFFAALYLKAQQRKFCPILHQQINQFLKIYQPVFFSQRRPLATIDEVSNSFSARELP